MLEVRDLCAWHGAAQALFGVSLRVAVGELVVLQGLNGAGKSTLLQAAMGLVPRVAGTISYQNESIIDLPPFRRAQRGLGYVPEDRCLFTALTVKENLRIAARTDVKKRSAAAEIARQEDLVLTLFPALKPMLRRNAAQMSGGEQQRVDIARALLNSPKLILADEPTGSLDPETSDEIMQLLIQIAKDYGTTVIMATHDFIVINRYPSRMLKTEMGKLIDSAAS